MAFIPVHLNTLRPDEPLPFDVHLRLSAKEAHYVHYIKKFDPLENERYSRLKQLGLKKVFIESKDEDAYLDYLDQGLTSLEQQGLAVSEKATLARAALDTQAENAERSLESENSYNRMQNQLDKVASFFKSDSKAFKNMLTTSGIALDNTQHSANVASLALGIATGSGISESKDLLDLGIACLVHDIGATKLGIDPLASRNTLQGDALKRYLRHPEESVAMLAGKAFITPRVLALIIDHEEFGEGRGYPEKKRIDKLQPISQILNLANAFDKFCMRNNKSPIESIDSFFEEYMDHFVLDQLTVLSSVVTAK